MAPNGGMAESLLAQLQRISHVRHAPGLVRVSTRTPHQPAPAPVGQATAAVVADNQAALANLTAPAVAAPRPSRSLLVAAPAAPTPQTPAVAAALAGLANLAAQARTAPAPTPATPVILPVAPVTPTIPPAQARTPAPSPVPAPTLSTEHLNSVYCWIAMKDGRLEEGPMARSDFAATADLVADLAKPALGQNSQCALCRIVKGPNGVPIPVILRIEMRRSRHSPRYPIRAAARHRATANPVSAPNSSPGALS